MYPKKCGECGGTVQVSQDAVPVSLRGETYLVAGIKHGQCSECGETYLDLEAMKQVQQAAVRQARQSRNLLLPDEIRDLRAALGLSQPALEALLGVGPKTVTRWEKGTVFQSATADRLMRAIRAVPGLIGILQGGELYGKNTTCRTITACSIAGQWQGRRVSAVKVVERGSNAFAA